MVMISERPAEINDRAVPGHWEGDLIFGRRMTAIGTLVERWSRYVMLVALPDGHTAEAVRIALAAKITTLPDALRQSLTWDQGKEMADHVRFSVDTGVHVYFCDPKAHGNAAPTRTPTDYSANTSHAPPTSPPSPHTTSTDRRSLNGRPRQTLNWLKPSEKFAEAVAMTPETAPFPVRVVRAPAMHNTLSVMVHSSTIQGALCRRQCRCSSQRGLPAAVSVLQCPHAGQVGVAVAVERDRVAVWGGSVLEIEPASASATSAGVQCRKVRPGVARGGERLVPHGTRCRWMVSAVRRSGTRREDELVAVSAHVWYVRRPTDGTRRVFVVMSICARVAGGGGAPAAMTASGYEPNRRMIEAGGRESGVGTVVCVGRR